MAQMRAAVGADGFNPAHTVFVVNVLCNGGFIGSLRKAGPAAASVELGFRVEQLFTAAHAVVSAVSPDGFVFACESALGSSVAGDFKGDWFCAFFLEKGFPFGVGFLDFGGHGVSFKNL